MRIKTLAAAGLIAVMTTGSASAWSISGQALLSTSDGAAMISVAKPWHLAAWAVGAVAAGYVAFNSIRLLHGASGGGS